MVRKGSTKRKRVIENFENKPGREKPDEGREHVTKYLQKVYNYVTKESDLFWGLKVQDIVPENAKRVPSAKRTKVETPKESETPEDTPRPTVSEGYGEATLGSISRLLRALETLEDEDLRLSRNSTFVDIGSGYGKVVFHARLFSRVKKSFGIEYVQRRYDIAQRAREHFCFGHVFDQKPRETDKENHAGNATDAPKNVETELGALLDVDDVNFVCDDATNQAPFNYTHIYMYDCIFSEDTYEKLLPQLETSPFKILVSFRTLPFLTSRGLTHIRPLGTIRISSTGRQCFTAHIYAKSHGDAENGTTNTTTGQQDAQMQDTPTQDAPTQDAPTQDPLTRDAPTKDAPTQDAPTQDAPTQDAPTKDAPTQDAPTQDAPTQDAPTQDTPTQDTQMQDISTLPQLQTPTAEGVANETKQTLQEPTHTTYISQDAQTPQIPQDSQTSQIPQDTQTPQIPQDIQPSQQVQILPEPHIPPHTLPTENAPEQIPQEKQQELQEPQEPRESKETQEPKELRQSEEQEPQITISQQPLQPETQETQQLQQTNETPKSMPEPIPSSSEQTANNQETTNEQQITSEEITNESKITEKQQPATEPLPHIPSEQIIPSSEITQQTIEHTEKQQQQKEEQKEQKEQKEEQKEENKDEVDVILLPEQPTEDISEQDFLSPKLRARQIL